MNNIFSGHFDEISAIFVNLAEQVMPDFAKARNDYLNTLKNLKNNHPENAAIIDQLHTLLNQRITMDILYMMNCGYQDNLKNFKDPVNCNFLEKTWDSFLREKGRISMAPRIEVVQRFDSLFKAPFILNSEESDFILDYIGFIDTIIPKLAHFKGYLLANDLLYYTEPGYYADLLLTTQYQRMINDYFQTDISLI
ncbi:MAG: hypothetical protein IJN82_02060 [Clostridia bacterium]|nr:hypothetical protein [Clostridia bacterium]